ncbi:helix-turn-helix transcriptional regulator [Paenibacillus macerans]|uniref:Helix-turn-helix family protein n=1 Tax=Paenibacillus macerans TaxID=44252 RepID=A0A090YLZ4_PAEMA|nr:helix-turn-helix transcriptional regulator [Paenibacillus macerans]KFM93155.1 helix-turn-helix family protein [Paenibacillus macerans]MCY7561590.1 helix-turn-helix transcriptional regulator [Paenibacillus macerans]MEC0153311.1 helix-turn-helix transcriptional regulator [Paenibacillus macerans]SUA84835.1 transcriptional regulator [Paenibacillus macerans]
MNTVAREKKRTLLIISRKSKGLTQSELAERVGISRPYLANIERGEYDPSLKVAQLLSQQLGKPIDDLF